MAGVALDDPQGTLSPRPFHDSWTSPQFCLDLSTGASSVEELFPCLAGLFSCLQADVDVDGGTVGDDLGLLVQCQAGSVTHVQGFVPGAEIRGSREGTGQLFPSPLTLCRSSAPSLLSFPFASHSSPPPVLGQGRAPHPIPMAGQLRPCPAISGKPPEHPGPWGQQPSIHPSRREERAVTCHFPVLLPPTLPRGSGSAPGPLAVTGRHRLGTNHVQRRGWAWLRVGTHNPQFLPPGFEVGSGRAGRGGAGAHTDVARAEGPSGESGAQRAWGELGALPGPTGLCGAGMSLHPGPLSPLPPGCSGCGR